MFNLIKNEYFFSLAQRLTIKGENEKAISIYKKAIKLKPSYVGLRIQLGLTFQKIGKYERAKEELRQAQKYNPSKAVIPMFIGGVFLEECKYEEALNNFNKSLSLDPENELCMSLKGLALLYLEKKSEGIDILSRHFLSGNQLLEFLVLFYCEMLCVEKGIDSLQVLEKSLENRYPLKKINPFISKLTNTLTKLLNEIEYWIEAKIISIKSLISKDEAKFLRHIATASKLLSTNCIDEAKIELKKCTKMDFEPKVDQQISLCLGFYYANDYNYLEKLLEKYFAQILKENTDIVMLKAKNALHLRQYDKAMKLLEDYEKKSIHDFWPDYIEGVCALRKKKISTAKLLFKKTVASSKAGLTRSYFAHINHMIQTKSKEQEQGHI